MNTLDKDLDLLFKAKKKTRKQLGNGQANGEQVEQDPMRLHGALVSEATPNTNSRLFYKPGKAERRVPDMQLCFRLARYFDLSHIQALHLACKSAWEGFVSENWDTDVYSKCFDLPSVIHAKIVEDKPGDNFYRIVSSFPHGVFEFPYKKDSSVPSQDVNVEKLFETLSNDLHVGRCTDVESGIIFRNSERSAFILTDFAQKLMENLDEYYPLSANAYKPSASGEDHPLATFLRTQTTNNWFLWPNEGADMAKLTEVILPVIGQPGVEVDALDRDEYWIAYADWLRATAGLDDREVILWQTCADVRWTYVRWWQALGQSFVDVEKLRYRLTCLETMDELKDTFGTFAAAEEAARKVHDQQRQKLDRDAVLSFVTEFTANGATTSMTPDESEQYRVRIKRLISRAIKLLHPDRTAQKRFTDAQRKNLIGLWHEFQSLRSQGKDQTLGASGNVIETGGLEDVIARAEAIWEVEGLRIDPALLIQGATLAEKVEWLKGHIERLELDHKRLDSDILALNSADLRSKTADLASPKMTEARQMAFEEEGMRLASEVEELERKLHAHFK